MIPQTLASTWTSLWASQWTQAASAMGNHLWQSTLLAAMAGALTLVLRKNQARARYWLWMAASVKFLIPFSWLVAIGNRLAWSRPASANTSLYVVIEQVSQPFARPVLTAPLAAPIASGSLLHLLPALLAGVWFCGFARVLLLWCVRWRRVSAALRSAVPLHEGREVEALRRLERASGIRTRIELLLSRAMLEPGIFGMTRPVLVWPEGISEYLENPHLEAILAHELWHVRRRDNLAAAIHMLVEAVFWFHPLVWWLGARLVEERERACDEEVLEFGSERRVYAESILKVCEFCVGSPLACVSGVTGADLKKRMVHIMSEHVIRKLDFSRKLLLGAVASLAIAVPIGFGLVHATPSRAQSQSDSAAASTNQFESVSIKPSQLSASTYPGGKNQMMRMMFGPGGYQADNVTLRMLIQEAYGLQPNQILGGPDWLDTAAYDVEAKSAGDPMQAAPEKRRQENKRLLQVMLADRARLAVHRETRELPGYVLTLAEGGSKLQPAQPDGLENTAQLPVIQERQGAEENSPLPGGNPTNVERRVKIGPDGHPMTGFQMFTQTSADQGVGVSARGVPLEAIVRQLSMQLKTNVVDKTGLHGLYDFNLHWAANAGDSSTASDSASEPSLFTAVEQQLGLKLQAQKAPTPVLVIDHIEKPEEVASASR